MKKSLLLFMLLPLIGFTQNASELLVKWHGIGVQPQPWIPTTQPSYFNNSQISIEADDITGVGINFYYNSNNGFEGTGWSTNSNSPNLGKYFLLKISPKEGYQLNLTQFSFNYMGNNKKMRISYSKNAAFTNPTSVTVNNIVINDNSTNYTMSLTGNDAHIVYGESLYIRIYGYQNKGNASSVWRLNDSPAQSANSSGSGPAIYGTISPYATSGVTANADTATTPESTAVNINVTGNDNAVSTTIASVAVTQQSANGTATVQPDKTITFTPNNGYTGTTNFQYTITGADGSTSAAMVTVTVNPFTAPTANADSVTTGQNIPVTINVLSNDIAGDGTINSVTILSAPAHGTATLNGNNIVYTPNSSYTGSDSLTYKITDSNNKTANATVSVSIVPVQAPTAQNDNAATAKNTSITLDVIANDTPGNSAITTIAITGNPSHGTVTVNSDKTLTYDPTNGYTGTDSFSYTITNAYNTSSSATVNMTVLNPNATGTLCGTYYVGINGDFTTITAAVNHLNSYGVACPVTFILKDALYNNALGETFPITINNFTGSTPVNTVTFKPNTGVNVKIEANNAIVNYTTQAVPAVFKLDGADNIIFDGSNTTGGSTRNLTIKNNGNINYLNRSVIWIASNGSNGATNNTVKYCNIKQEYKNSGSNFCTGVFSGNNGAVSADNTSTANNSDLKVIGNDFMNVKQGVYINGGSSTLTTNVTISQNDLGSENNTETIIQPAYISNVNGFEYTENYIYNLYRDNNSGSLVSTGLYVAGNSSNGTIARNEMKDLTKATSDSLDFAGIILSSTNTSSNIVVANNFILNVAGNDNGGLTGNGYGISIINGGGYKIYNNTVVLNTPQSNIYNSDKGFSSALYITNSSNIDVRNNIFVNNQNSTTTRRCGILIYGNISMLSNLDYNDIFSADKIGYIGTNPTDINNSGYIVTLSGWQSATGKEANSVDINPVFVSSSDLHLSANENSELNDLGTPIASVTKDIDGQIRDTAAPDMGADEFGPIVIPTGATGEGIYCDTSVTWDGTNWIGGEPTASTDVIFTGDFTQNGGTLYACSIYVIDGANVTFENNSNAIVTHSVNVEEGSTLTFESSCDLVQIENTANEGTVTIKRDSSMIKRLDYTIWSSPVSGTQSLLDFSPETLTNRFYDFDEASNIFFSIADPANTLFEKGQGYLIRVANNHPSNVPTVYHGEFIGTPNNGTVRVPLEYLNGDLSYKMVGNPYPSPININKFIDANIDNIEGTLWVWRKTNDPTKTTYCTITKMGWVANSAPGGNSANGGNQLIGNPFEIVSGGALNTGQGFFVRALNNNEVVFNNNMRESVNFNNFFRTENTDEQQQDVMNQTNRYWINLVTEDESVFSQILVAHSALATNGYDNGYDGKAFLDGGVSLYTIVEGGATEEENNFKLSIQSRTAFSEYDTVKVGFNTGVAGTFSFTIDHMDGIFADGQDIYLVDKMTNTTYNLANGNYTFDSEIGTFDDRFEIIYTIESLGTTTPEFTKNEVTVYQNNKELSINAPQNIESVVIYDLLGKVLYQNAKVESNKFTTTLNAQQQVAIVTITLENNQVVSKKVMIN